MFPCYEKNVVVGMGGQEMSVRSVSLVTADDVYVFRLQKLKSICMLLYIYLIVFQIFFFGPPSDK